MSTRCQIKFEGSPVILYRHSDGYPEGPGVLRVLLPFVQDFFRRRGYDSDYLPAHCLGAFLAENAKNHERFQAEHLACAGPHPAKGCFRCERYAEGPDLLGYGVSIELHGDIEYLYTVRLDGAVIVEHRKWTGNGSRKKIDEIPLTTTIATSEEANGERGPDGLPPRVILPITHPLFLSKLEKRVDPEGKYKKAQAMPKTEERHRTMDP